MSLKLSDEIPDWITHVLYADEEFKVVKQGERTEVLNSLRDNAGAVSICSRQKTSLKDSSNSSAEKRTIDLVRRRHTAHPPDIASTELPEPLVQISGALVKYKGRSILGGWHQNGRAEAGLWWEVRRGQRWGIFGPNGEQPKIYLHEVILTIEGSGKTTLLSLITSDHPQAYSTAIRLFQRSRLPALGERGISIHDLQSRMGHSSAEVHNFFPRDISLRRVLESAWADTPRSKPALSIEADTKVSAALQWFRSELTNSVSPSDSQSEVSSSLTAGVSSLNQLQLSGENLTWAQELSFGEASFSAQRVALFLRAVIKNPDIVILDEAFSGMDGQTRTKCLSFLESGITGTFNEVILKALACRPKLKYETLDI
jgi:ABC-type molybdenum transport system ATPase subunit/photorepair protein PhrA